MRTIVSWAFVLCAVAPCTGVPDARASSPHLVLSGDLAPGEHAVGFIHETLPLENGVLAEAPTDRVGDVPSALDLYLWFPSTADSHSGGGSMTLADYYRIQAPAIANRESLRQRLLDDMTSPPGIDAADLDRVLDSPTWARRGSDPLRGPHPLVLWSYRDSVPTMQLVLNEFLASNGYVVAFAWPRDNAPPLPWQIELSEHEKRAVLHRQVELLEAVLDGLAGRAWIDVDRSAVLAWSYGGESANLLQRRRSQVRLALGVDATLAGGGVFSSQENWDRIDRAELTVPYVLLRNGRPRLGADQRPAPQLLREVPAGAWHVRFPPLSHGNFNVPGGMIPGVLGLEEVSAWAVGGVPARRGYELICRYALGFLDHHLRPGRRGPDPSRWFALEPGEVEIENYPKKERP